MADHGKQIRLDLVGSLRSLPRAALVRKSVDKTLNLREQIVRPKVLRSHDRLSTP